MYHWDGNRFSKKACGSGGVRVEEVFATPAKQPSEGGTAVLSDNYLVSKF
jgi:hypothetical protein